ncbi:hypothetical protein PAXRUDRAFT_835542, partial [Paxillus rubicundulus Ve08.2h10]
AKNSKFVKAEEEDVSREESKENFNIKRYCPKNTTDRAGYKFSMLLQHFD